MAARRRGAILPRTGSRHWSTSPVKSRSANWAAGARRHRAADRLAPGRSLDGAGRRTAGLTPRAVVGAGRRPALPARLLGDVAGKRVADLCAAPGGKTAQLALAGAAGDRGRPSPKRLQALPKTCDDCGSSDDRRGRHSGIRAGAAVRRRAPRCALLVDRHHPPPSRRALDQERRGHRQARRPAERLLAVPRAGEARRPRSSIPIAR